MKLFSNKFLHVFLYIITIFFLGCNDEPQVIEDKIETHQNNIYNLRDSIKIMDHRIDSLLKLYSKK